MSLPLGVDMSRQATAYLSENLPEIRRATYTDKSQKTGTRALGEDGLALLFYLCDHANAKDGHRFFMTAESMREDAGIATLRTVRRLLAGFTELGWITPTGETVRYMGRGKPTPVYALTLVPGVSVNAQNERIGVRTGAPGDISTDTKANNANTSRENYYSEPEPQPEPDPQAGRGAGAWGIEHDQLLAECLACEDTKGDNGRLVPWLEKQYRPIVLRALEERPDPDLVGWCVDTRRGIERTKAPKKCETCNGYVFRSGGDPLDGRHALWNYDAGQWEPCPVCETDLADLTPSTPSPTSHADPDRIRELIKQSLRIVG
jgi:hypothetical protein